MADRSLTVYRPTVGHLLANSECKLLADSWLSVGPQSGNSPQTIGHQSAGSQPTASWEGFSESCSSQLSPTILRFFFFFFSICTTFVTGKDFFLNFSCQKKDNCGTKSNNNFGFRFTVGDDFLSSAGYHRRPENFQLGKKSTLFQILYGEQNYIFATVVIGLIIKIVVFLTWYQCLDYSEYRVSERIISLCISETGVSIKTLSTGITSFQCNITQITACEIGLYFFITN